jgi:site-specific recombinase XerD
MNDQPVISLFLDTRRAKKKSGKYPVKLRVFTSAPRIQKLYNTKFEFTEKEFESIYLSKKPRTEHKEIRLQLQAIEHKAIDTAKELKPFTFEQFEKRLFRKASDGENIFYQYLQTIEHLKKQGQIGTANTYELSLKSIKEYCKHLKGKTPKDLSFYEVTPKWLQGYEKFMIDIKGRSITTVAIYLRALRALFNKTIHEGEIPSEIYPFGKRKYQVPAVKRVKKALNKAELKMLFEAQPQTPEQTKAKDFWFFSYACYGMNIKDIALLKNKNIQGDKIVYYRAKTIRTSKANLEPIIVHLNDFTKYIIEKYRTGNNAPESLVFDIVNENEDLQVQHNKSKNFTRFINQNLKKLAEKNGITGEISTYWARHSFATNAIRNGVSIELVSTMLDHSDVKVTKGYFAGYEEETLKELMGKLMDF